MQPGSLIFLVIVAVWAVYLVQHWIRRRDHLATARSVDRFSDAMRILERRAAPLAGTPDPYAASPTGAGAVRPALVGRKAAERGRGSAATARAPHGAGSARRRPVARPGLVARRIRGVVVLAALAAVPLTVVLSLVSVLSWVSVLVALATLVVVVAWTRATVRREQAVRRAARVAQRRRVRPARPVAERLVAERPADERPVAERPVAERPGAAPVVEEQGQPALAELSADAPTADAPTADAPTADAPTAERVVYDLMAVDEADRAAVAAAAFAQEWSPVPVPTPTYMLKDSAPRQSEWDQSEWDLPAAAMVPVPIEVEDDELEQLMAARHRRIVG